MKTVELTLYSFAELSDKAKKKAHDTYLQDGGDFEHIAEFIVEDAKECAECMGIEIEHVYYSGFSSQGDGACFVGSYAYKPGALKAIREHAPQDERLHRIAAGLQDVQKRAFYALRANVKHSGHYMHENCTNIDVKDTRTRWEDASEENEESVSEYLRDFMKWIYRQLEAAYYESCKIEMFADACESNEWTFEESGRMNNGF